MAKPLMAALLAVAFVVPLAPLASAQSPRLALDLQDLPEDVIIDAGRGSDTIGARVGVDVLRYQQAVEGEEAVVTLTFAGAPGEPGALFDAIGQLTPTLGQGFQFKVRWDAQGEPPAATAVSYTFPTLRTENATIEKTATTLSVRFPLPPEATCMTMLGSVEVEVDDVEYTDWLSPTPNPCDEDALLDGAQDDCAAVDAPSGKDPAVADFADEEDDVRATTMAQPEGDVVDKPQYDITHVTSERDGNRIVQTVTLAAPRDAVQELRLRVVNRLDAERDGRGEAEYAVVPLYWRFNNASQQDRSHGEFVHDGAKDDFATELDIMEATYTFSWCASLIPDDARCFGIEVIAEAPAYFTTGVRDVARPTVDPCLGAGAATPPTSSDDEPTDEEPADEEPTETEDGGAESPGFGVLALLAALGAIAVLRRR